MIYGCCVPLSDDYWYYEEWQQSLEKVAKNSRALLEAYGEKCRERGVGTV